MKLIFKRAHNEYQTCIFCGRSAKDSVGVAREIWHIRYEYQHICVDCFNDIESQFMDGFLAEGLRVRRGYDDKPII